MAATADDPQPLVELDIVGLTQGPDAIARHHGRAVFVRGAAPGDRVRVRIVEDHERFARAEVVARVAGGPHYREPPCPWIAACGGCPWQHVTYPAQLAAKAANVREALARLAGVRAQRELPIIAAPSEWAYRRRIRLHVDERRRVGYVRPRSRDVVEIDTCATADPAIAAALSAVRALVESLATPIASIELATNGRGGVAAHLTTTAAFAASDAATLARAVMQSPLAAVRIAGHGFQQAWGDPTIVVESGAAAAALQPVGTFTQVNAAANQLLVRAVVDIVGRARKVLDLFCGAGNFSLPLAAGDTPVMGVDRDRDAVASAVAIARTNGLTQARFEVDAAEHFVRQQGCVGADVVLLDPPRTGAPRVATQLARLRPKRIVYVSCDPATLARDVRTLSGGGYTIDRVQPIDLFPQTEHVETVVEAILPRR